MMLLTFDDMPPQSSKPASNVPYIIAILIMMGLGVIAVLTVTALRPNSDNTILIATVLGFLAPTTMGLMAFMKAQETHLAVNSRLDAFMNSARRVGHLEGEQIGHAAGIVEGELRIKPAVSTIVVTTPSPPAPPKGDPKP